MNSKKEYIILGVIIIGTLIYLYRHQQNKVHYQLPTLHELNVAKVDKIVIKQDKDDIVLKKADDGTWILGRQGYKADASKVDQILGKVSKVKLTALISTSKNYQRYQLDKVKGISVSLFSGDTRLRTLVVGKTAPTYANSYLRVNNDPNIYLADQNLKYDLDQDSDSLRDKNIFSFDPAKVQDIVLENHNGQLQLTQSKNASQVVWATPQGQHVRQENVTELLTKCNNLRCVSFLDKKKAVWKQPDYRIGLRLTSGQSKQLSIFIEKKDEKNKNYYGLSNIRKYPFELPQYTSEKIVQSIDSLFSKYKKTGNK